jgi:hypothetical protein
MAVLLYYMWPFSPNTDGILANRTRRNAALFCKTVEGIAGIIYNNALLGERKLKLSKGL